MMHGLLLTVALAGRVNRFLGRSVLALILASSDSLPRASVDRQVEPALTVQCYLA